MAAVAAAGALTPAVAEASLQLLDMCRSRNVEAAVVSTMQRVAMLIGETLARQHAPPSTRLVEALAPLELSDPAQLATARAQLAAAFAPGGTCDREAFCDDVAFFLQASERMRRLLARRRRMLACVHACAASASAL